MAKKEKMRNVMRIGNMRLQTINLRMRNMTKKAMAAANDPDKAVASPYEGIR